MTKQGETFIAIEPLKELPLEVYENGVHVETTELQRQQPRLKSTSFIGQSDAERKHIAEEGIFEALLIKDGKILEGMTSNFFYVKIRREGRNEEQSKHEKILYTARYGVLLGVTRETVIQIAGDRGLDVKYQALKRDQLSAAREAFITSSSRGIVPVMRIDGVTIGQGRPGLVTKELMAAYQEYVLANAEQI
jgi:branched-chain amino acid aminotransferase